MVSADIGRILIASWLQGEHLDDLKQMPIGDFDNQQKQIVSELKKGNLNAIDIAKSTIGIPQMSELISGYSPALYENVMLNILRDRMHEELEGKKKALPGEVSEIAQKYSREWTRKRPQPANLIDSFVSEMDARKKGLKIQSGIRELDRLTYGIHKGQLTSIGARPGTGKSALMLQVAINVARSGAKVMFLPLEMSAVETMERIVMRFTSDVSSSAMRSGDLSEAQWKTLMDDVFLRLEDIGDNFSVYVGENKIEDIEWMIEEHKPDFVVIDQLSQLKSSKVEFYSVRERFAHMTSTLKSIALNKNVAIWLACQLNREAKLNGKAMIENLKEAGNIEEDSDNVILLSNSYDENGEIEMTENVRKVTMTLAKQRQGPPGEWAMDFLSKRFIFQSEPEGYEQMRTDDVPF